MFAIAVTYMISPGREEEAAAHFRVLIAPSRAEPGNVGYHVYRSQEEPRRFRLFEVYADEAAFQAHRDTPHFIEHIENGVLNMAESREADRCLPLDGE